MNNTVGFHNSRTLEGKYIVITGATSGIGYAAAKALVLKGAKLGIVARSRSKAAELSAELGKMTNGEAQVDCFIADMSSQQDIRRAAAEILNRVPRIDRLINNA